MKTLIADNRKALQISKQNKIDALIGKLEFMLTRSWSIHTALIMSDLEDVLAKVKELR